MVELLANDKTASDVLPIAEQFYASCSRITIRVEKEVPGHVANRLQAALWREAIHLVNDGVASVEDVDKAVWAGPGLRWAAMGPHMLFNLGSGGHGIGMFCERYAPSFHRWWHDLGQPKLTPNVVGNSRITVGLLHSMIPSDEGTKAPTLFSSSLPSPPSSPGSSAMKSCLH